MSAIWRSLESPPGTPQAPREPLFPPMIQRLHFQNVSRLVAQELVEMTLLPLRYLGFGPPTDHLAPRLKWNTLEFLRSLGQNVAAESTPSSCLQPAPFSSYLGSVLAARTSCNPQPTLPNSSHNLQAAWRSALQQGSLCFKNGSGTKTAQAWMWAGGTGQGILKSWLLQLSKREVWLQVNLSLASCGLLVLWGEGR